MSTKPTYGEFEQRIIELTERERRYRYFFENAPQPYQSLDEEGKLLEVNAAWRKTLGYGHSEIIGQSFSDLLAPDYQVHFKSNFARFKAAGEIHDVQFQMVRKDGNIIDVAFEGRIAKDLDGDFLQTNCLLIDITQRKQMEKALRERETKFRELVESSSDWIWEVNKEGVYTYASPQVETILGYRPEEVVGKTPFNLMPPEEAERIARIFKAVQKEGKLIVALDNVNLDKSGRRVALETSGVPVYDEDGNVTGYRGIDRDITERKQAEKALQKSEQRFRTIFEQAAVGVALIETRTGRFLRINQRYCDMVGYTIEEMSGGKRFQEITHPEDLQPDLDHMARLLAGEIREFTLEQRYCHKNGSIAWVKLTVSPTWDPGEEPQSHIAVVEDITERKRAQERLKARERTLSSIFRAAPIGIGLVIDRIFKEVNDTFCAMTGYSQEALLGQSARMIYPNEDTFERAGREKYKQIRESGSGSVETQFRRKDGAIIDVLLSSTLLDINYPTAGSTFTALDITERKRAEEELARASAEWTQAMDQHDDAVYMLDMQRHLVRANQAFYRMISSEPDHCLGHHIVELVHSEGEEEPCPICQAQEARREVVITLEADDFNNPSGRPIEASLKMVRDDSGNAIAMLMTLRDLTRSRKVEERLRLAASVFENTAEGVLITDAEANIVEVNRAFTEILGYSREEVIGFNPRLLQSGRHDESFYRAMWRAIKETGYWRGELWNRRKNGSVFPEWHTISSVFDDTGKLTHYVGLFSDISQIKKSQALLDHLAHHDALTDLPNRLLLNERLEQAIKHAERHASQLAIIFLDLDHFKHINDSLGHPIGDQLLQEVATNLERQVRQDDTVARIGGDEFVLLLEDIGRPENATVTAQKLMSTFSKPFQLAAHEVRVTASLGICIYPQDGKDPATLLRNADAAMYRAKEGGRNTYQFYTEALTLHAFERVLLENHLRRAIEREQLRLLYQPKVDLYTKQVIGLEALIRWQHPDRGMVSPARFIPLAEDCGLIHPIGEWVLRTACLQGREWLQRGIEFGRIAVNIAASQIQRGGLPDVVSTILAEVGFPPSRLELEVTEGFVMQQAAFVIGQLDELRRLGVTLAIDDFGTGYSSLNYLKTFPINKLKIDQSFVRHIPHDPNDMAISDAIIKMGKSLGLSVIAEGIETEEQASFLKQAGCQEAQGYLYSKPLGPEELEKRLRRQDD